MTLIILK